MAVTMKNAVFWDVEPCTSCVSRRFGGGCSERRFTQDLHGATSQKTAFFIKSTVLWDMTPCSLVGGFIGTTSARLYGVTSQKTVFLMCIVLRTSIHK
jgi:hypothetical protein